MTDLFERVLLLKQSSMFTEVGTENLTVVARTLEEEACFAGDRLFEINDRGDHMYILLTGKVGISTNPDPAVQTFVAVLGPGDCFGEMGMLDAQPRSATAHVLEDSTMLALDWGKLRGLIRRYPELALGMLRGLSLRLRSANIRAN